MEENSLLLRIIPNEVLLVISDNLETTDINAFSQTCRRLANILIPVLCRIACKHRNFRLPPICWAAQKGYINVVKRLIDMGCNTTGLQHYCDRCQLPHTSTVLHWAAKGENAELVNFLLDRGENIDAVDNRNATPLHWVCSEGGTEVVKLLVSRGADLEIEDCDGDTALRWAAERSNAPVFKLLLDSGCSKKQLNLKSETVLHTIFLHGEEDLEKHACVVKMLLEHGFDLLRHRDQFGDTALHLAAKFGDVESMKLMLDHGIPVDWHGPPNSPAPTHNSPALNYAIESGKLEAIELLLQRGANPDSTPTIPLDLAVEYGRVPVIELLIKYGANVHCRNNNGDTVLHWAVQTTQVGVLDYFLQRPELGLDVNVQNRHLITPLHRACFMDPDPNWEIVDLLLRQENIQVDLQDDYGRTALINASETGAVRLIEALISKGADVNICDHQGNSALHKARDPRAWQVLKAAGAKVYE